MALTNSERCKSYRERRKALGLPPEANMDNKRERTKRSHSKPEYLERRNSRYINRRNEWLANKSCAVCQTTDRLEIDHIDPLEKSFAINWGFRWERLISELAKCQVLCYKHHKEKTKTDLKLIAEAKRNGTWARSKETVTA